MLSSRLIGDLGKFHALLVRGLALILRFEPGWNWSRGRLVSVSSFRPLGLALRPLLDVDFRSPETGELGDLRAAAQAGGI